MVKLKYEGPKPIISHRGIEFDNNKEDKFIYLNAICQLIQALDHDYIEDKVYTYDTGDTKLHDKEMYHLVHKFNHDIDAQCEEAEQEAQEEVNEELERARKNETLSDADRDVLIKNIEIMSDYIIQRAINKRFYYAAVSSLATIVQRDHIDYIVAPMLPELAHAMHSVQGVLKELKRPIDTRLDIYEEDEQLMCKLKVVNILQEQSPIVAAQTADDEKENHSAN